ncbi:MAG: UbiA family prenyltransferase, partial [Candidatus Heimdallarchaeota archaeon]|nr:UbiA family prenyltransferase [Candidatus Heimdallarchaeota archaeon]
MTVNRYSKKQIFLSYITILRLVNGIVAGFAATFGVVLSLQEGKDPNYLSISLVVLTTMFVSSQAMIFNDIVDRDVDAINAPHRPIPTGKISIKSAKIYGCIVALLALGTAVAMDVEYKLYGISVITVIIFGGSLDLYNVKFKKMGFFGNTIIGLNVIALFAYGTLHTYLIYGGDFAWVPIVVGVAAGSGNIGREVIKG